MNQISRNNTSITSVATEDAIGDCEVIPYGQYAGGLIYPGTSVTSLTFWTSNTADGTFVPLYDKANSAVTYGTVGAVRSYPFPDEIFGARFVKIVTNGDYTCDISLKG